VVRRSEPCCGVAGCDCFECVCDGLLELFGGSGFCHSEVLFELGPGFLDGVEIGRVGRQVEHFGAGRLDPLADALDLPLSFAVAFRLVLRDRSEREDVPRYWNSILSCCQRADAFIDLGFLMS
jgi:hypothetical protein